MTCPPWIHDDSSDAPVAGWGWMTGGMMVVVARLNSHKSTATASLRFAFGRLPLPLPSVAQKARSVVPEGQGQLLDGASHKIPFSRERNIFRHCFSHDDRLLLFWSF